MVVTLGEDAPSYDMVKKWAAEFKRGRENLKDDPRPGRPITVTTQETIAKIHDIIVADRRADLNSFLRRFVTMDETWVHHFQPETKQQSKQWKHPGSPPPKKAKTVMVMASIFWDAEGVLLVDYLDKGHTITGAYYSDLLRQLREKIRIVGPGDSVTLV
ncbi:uncharacterized protein LOC121381476 [Gigantopelta aegis]|uniref:uncharacterized protein LOC121381476 n=1 Tax=Gigantopelta aegis TaxID=1735272 RepID=UPI001B88C054|nr:uncharacterized protein LOC121381476 [Gigantopelta aegis]